MDIKTIQCMLNNSTWFSPEKRVVYSFSGGDNISINGNPHFHYTINSHNDNIEIQIGYEKKYKIEYINDFILKLHNSTDSFRLMPE